MHLRIFSPVLIYLNQMITIALLLVIACTLSVATYAQESWLNLVSVEQGEHSRDIVFQTYNGQWQTPVWLTQGSRTDEFSPANLRVSNSQILVLWKELTGVDASNLLYTQVDVDPNGLVLSVGQIQTVKTETAHQSSPTLIRDPSGQVWGFWVGFNGTEDDIYFATFSNEGWTEEKRLYEQANGVPDVRPTARFNVDGAVELRWQQYSFDEGAYIDVYSFLEPANQNPPKWSKPSKYIVNPLEKAPQLPRDFSLPQSLTMPDSVAINYAEYQNVVIHWDKLPRAADLPGNTEELNN